MVYKKYLKVEKTKTFIRLTAALISLISIGIGVLVGFLFGTI